MKNQNTKNNKGITLVALIITIIVLLILAVVAIGAVQEDGIIGKAKYARDEYEKAQAKENSILQGYLEKINENVGNGNTGDKNNSEGTDNSETEGTAPLVDEYGNDAKNKVLSETANTDVYDEFGNKILVPAGFMIRVDESTTYADHVTEGIVIEDVDGNQFVWIPVGNVYYNETEYKTITLGRYSDFTVNDYGEYVPVQTAEDYATAIAIESLFTEDTADNHNVDYKNAIAKDIGTFVTSAITKGGYYLARYEAGVINYETDREWISNERYW